VSDKDVRQKHIDSAVKRNIPRVMWRAPRKGKIAIVATGPSVGDYVDMLKEWDGEIWGINGAVGWMIHRGIKPHAFIGLDPEEMLKDYVPIPPDITYYLAAQVHPGVFDHLKDRNVRLWFHADNEVKFPNGAVPIPGGSSCLGRAPYLAYFLGWEDIHIFGGDSSFTHKTHVYGGIIPTNFIFAEAGGHAFKTVRNLMLQASDMVQIVTNFPGELTVHGNGLMQAMCEDVQKSGALEMLAAEEAATIAGLNRQQRRAMRHR
jgi:hypothetical protein